MADIIKLHVAHEDTSTARYDEIAVSTLTGFSNYATVNMRCLGAYKAEKEEGGSVEYIDGEVRGSLYMRDEFTLKLIPFSYRASEWDLTDWAAIKTKIRTAQKYQHSWIEITELSDYLSVSQAYHSANYAIPVRLFGISVDDNGEGFKEVTLNFKKAFRET